MKCAMVIASGVKQIMLTAEDEEEQAALELLSKENQEISVEMKEGSFFHHASVPQSARGYLIAECKGGYLRAYEDPKSLMLVLRPKKNMSVEVVKGRVEDLGSE